MRGLVNLVLACLNFTPQAPVGLSLESVGAQTCVRSVVCVAFSVMRRSTMITEPDSELRGKRRQQAPTQVFRPEEAERSNEDSKCVRSSQVWQRSCCQNLPRCLPHFMFDAVFAVSLARALIMRSFNGASSL